MAARVHEIRVDRSVPLAKQPGTGHNRWHPRVPPILWVDPGDEAILDTRGGGDQQINPRSTAEEFAAMDLGRVHALTGPVWVNGAEVGDLLEVQILDVQSIDWGWTGFAPGFGFLRDLFDKPYLVHWRQEGGFAESPDMPGVRIPDASFPGVIGVAPSEELVRRATAREREAAERGAIVMQPDPRGAIPAQEPIASQGLRTMPPRENGGNLDVKDLVRGTTVYFPVMVEGALLSIGDPHYAQGDGESCGTAIETEATFHLRLDLIKGGARERNVQSPQYVRRMPARAREYYVTTGMSVRNGEVQMAEDANTAAYNALVAMIDHLQWRGYTREQAYVLCSAAVDLKLSEIVGLPNLTVSAFLPTDIFV